MPFLERAAPLSTLDALLDQGNAGAGVLAFVTGEAGIGKTTLLREFVARVRPRVPAWWGGCDPLRTPTPFGPILEILRQIGNAAARLDLHQPRLDLFAAMLVFLAQCPAVVVLEDLHWADEATLDLLRYLGRRIARTRTLIVGSYRDDELTPTHPLRLLLGDLATQRVPRLSLDPLSVAAVGTLAAGTAIDPAELHRQTGGNPFYVTEVVAIGGIGLPENVRDAVAARVARLAPASRTLLDIAAVAGPRIEPWLLERVAGAAARSLDECLALGVLRSEGDVFTFRHELARQAVLDSIPAWRRIELHRQVLGVLEATRTDDLARLVHHAALGQGSDAVMRWAPAAAEAAARHGAHREAAAHYGTALTYSAWLDHEERADLLERRSYECHLTADLAAAVSAREAALAFRRRLGQRIREGDNVRWLSRLAWFLGRGEEARRLADLAVRTLESEPPGVELAMAFSNKSQLHMLANENADAVAWGERAVALAEQIHAREALAHALNNVGASRIAGGDARGWDEVQRSLALALEHGLDEHAARAYCNLASLLVVQRQYARAATVFATAMDYCNDRALDSWTIYLMAWRARSALEQGCWDAADADARAVDERPGVPPIARIPALAVRATLSARRGDPEAAAQLSEVQRLAASTDEMQRVVPVCTARAEAAWIAGDVAACATEAAVALDAALRADEPWAIGAAATWMWRAGALQEIPARCAEPFVPLLRGDWKAAAQAWEDLGCPYDEALALAAGDCAAQRKALAHLDRLGATATAQAMRRAMRQRGVRDVPRGPRTTTLANAGGLTVREVDILALVAQGLSNAQIGARKHISVRTVDHHVGAILRKLDARSRSEAVERARALRMVAQVGQVPEPR